MQSMAASRACKANTTPALCSRSQIASSLRARAPARRNVIARGSKLAVWNKIDYVPASKVFP
eukprot:3226132-Pyramimonas_sp.AAC.2